MNQFIDQLSLVSTLKTLKTSFVSGFGQVNEYYDSFSQSSQYFEPAILFICGLIALLLFRQYSKSNSEEIQFYYTEDKSKISIEKATKKKYFTIQNFAILFSLLIFAMCLHDRVSNDKMNVANLVYIGSDLIGSILIGFLVNYALFAISTILDSIFQTLGLLSLLIAICFALVFFTIYGILYAKETK